MVTFIGTALAAALGMAAYSIGARFATVEGFFEYATARRLLSVLAPIAVLGYAVTLPVHVAKNPTKVTQNAGLAGEQLLLMPIVLGCLLVATLTLGRDLTGALSTAAIVATYLLAGAQGYAAVLFSLLRGYEDFDRSARLNISYTGLAPLATSPLLVFGTPSAITGWAVITFCCIALFAIREPTLRIRPRWIRNPGILARSIARVPGDIAFGLLFLAPVLMVPSNAQPAEKAVFAYVFTILTLVTAFAAPISVVILPKLAKINQERRTPIFWILIGLGVFVGAPISGLCFALPDHLVHLLLGAQYLTGADVIRSMAAAPLGLSVFALLRSSLDAWTAVPISPGLCLVALGVYFGRYLSSPRQLQDLADSVTWSMSSLGSLMVVTGLSFIRIARVRS